MSNQPTEERKTLEHKRNVLFRQQYTFRARQSTAIDILAGAAVKAVNVVALVWIGNQLTVVVGDPAMDTPVQNQLFEDTLKENGIRKFRIRTVLQVLNVQAEVGTPGAYVRYAKALVECHIRIDKSYFGEPAPGEILSVFFQVPRRKLVQAKKILSALQPTPRAKHE